MVTVLPSAVTLKAVESRPKAASCSYGSSKTRSMEAPSAATVALSRVGGVVSRRVSRTATVSPTLRVRLESHE